MTAYHHGPAEAVADVLRVVNAESADPNMDEITADALEDPAERAIWILAARVERAHRLSRHGWRETKASEDAGVVVRALLSIGDARAAGGGAA